MLHLSDLLCCFLSQDSTFEFEKQRHVPVKYRRELWEKSGTGGHLGTDTLGPKYSKCALISKESPFQAENLLTQGCPMD